MIKVGKFCLYDYLWLWDIKKKEEMIVNYNKLKKYQVVPLA